ncbi:SMI1/KNR4 family protein [Hymenobacter coccineus]|uniref:Knr4/Smi1-like domain-containing protein n=1 Tax=Hymenobacter coccineus TaxID=1908235 RepID=A0A1G1SSH5_9BACT|nr:SMI1/KNR4 family protein [Hymenobacter coccineus]OGX81563.1 hypothetical protein BEN49_15455 [Hymenobacter coccineus]
MTLETAFAEIQQFWPTGLPFAFGRGQAAARLSAEFGRPFPPDLVAYLDRVAPAEDMEFATVGNPLQLYGLARLGPQQPGYSFNPVTQTPLPDWNPAFFLLADEGADPLVLDLGQPAAGIRKLLHGAGNWDEGDPVADTLGQFLLCSAARHHALQAFEDEPIVDDAQGFRLAPQAAAWLFPRLKTWARAHYAAWCAAFDNA